MVTIKKADINSNTNKYLEIAIHGEPVIISCETTNVIMLSEQDYEEMAKAKRNAEYLAKLDESQEQLKNGQTISFTMEELKAMESENWKPTQKIIDFIRKNSNE